MRPQCGVGELSAVINDKVARVVALLLNRIFVRSNAFGLVSPPSSAQLFPMYGTARTGCESQLAM